MALYTGEEEFNEEELNLMKKRMEDYEKKHSQGSKNYSLYDTFDAGLHKLGPWSKMPFLVRFIWKDTPEGYDFWKEMFMRHVTKYAQMGIIIPGCEAYQTLQIGEEVFNI